jgi:succinate dehydrogenase/fumarate reductase flavoprotein subunit
MKGRIEMHPQFIGGQGPVRIDLDCRTTVEGLWAAGDAPSLGSGWTGARSSGGSYRGFGLCFAPISGFRAGQAISEYAASAKRFNIDAGEAKRVKKRVFEPLGRKGNLNSGDIIHEVHKAMVPMKNTFLREAGRLKNALKIIEGAKQNLPKVSAADFHELMRYHQAESMALAAEFTTKAALMREESRGQHYREDFPNRDDNNWLKWIVIQERDGVPKLSTEPVPIEKYKVKPS